jgi:hypothetical protein
MKIECEDFYRVLRGERADLVARLEAHAETCADCRKGLALWREISEAAPALRRERESPELWPRIRTALVQERETPRPAYWRLRSLAGALRSAGWQGALAAAALVLVSGAAAWVLLRNATPAKAPDAQLRLLTEKAVREIESAEEGYVRSIEKLSALVEPKIENPTSPLFVNYRERLTVIDAAIADCRAQIERNRFNTHLRKELLSIYREKQRTLEEIVGEERHERN